MREVAMREMEFLPEQESQALAYYRSREPKLVFVYVMEVVGGTDGRWKIGRTTDPAQRLANMQTATSYTVRYVKVVEAHPSLERSLHMQFGHRRIRGEWFDLSDEDKQMVLARMDGAPWIRNMDSRKERELEARRRARKKGNYRRRVR